MMRGKTKGFTIIEIMLFIAISGALLVVVTSTIGSRQQRVQFTDAMRNLQAFVENQLSYAQTGVNDVPGLSGLPCATAPDGCTVLGRAIIFSDVAQSAQIATSYLVTGKRLSADYQTDCGTLLSTLSCAQPSVNASSGTTYDLLWGARFTVGRFKSGIITKSLAFLRDPRASAVIPVAYDNRTSTPDAVGVINLSTTYGSSSSSQQGETVDAYYCFKSANNQMTAALAIVGTQIDMVFEPSVATYNCVP